MHGLGEVIHNCGLSESHVFLEHVRALDARRTRFAVPPHASRTLTNTLGVHHLVALPVQRRADGVTADNWASFVLCSKVWGWHVKSPGAPSVANSKAIRRRGNAARDNEGGL